MTDFAPNTKVKLSWMNLLGVIRWNCIFNERLFMNMTTYLSSYKYRSHEYVCNSDVQKEKRMWYWAGEVFSPLGLII